MAITITTGTGRVIDCDAISPGRQYPVLHIHTHALSGAEAYAVFSDPAETAELTETRDVAVTDPETGEQMPQIRLRVFKGFTALYSVGPSPFVAGALLIWLNRPAEFHEEAET